MNADPIVETLGWTLLHSLWQGVVVAAVCGVLLKLARNAPANVRYLTGCASLAAMMALAAATFSGQMTKSARLSPGTLPEASGVAVASRLAGPAGDPAGTPSASAPESAAATISGNPAAAAVSMKSGIAERSTRPDPRKLIRPWLPWIVSLWALGVGLLSLRFGTGWLAVTRLRKAAVELTDPDSRRRFAHLRAKLGVSRPVRLLSSAVAGVPMTAGWWRPIVLLPAELLATMPAGQLDAIVAHELAHIRRHDYLVNLLQILIETLFFFHPAVWWVSAQVRKEREHCCDDLASTASGGTIDYVKALAALEESLPAIAPSTAVAATANGRKGSLLGRVRRLLGVVSHPGSARRPNWPAGALMLLGVCAAILIPIAMKAADEKESDWPAEVPKAFHQLDLRKYPIEFKLENLPEIYEPDEDGDWHQIPHRPQLAVFAPGSGLEDDDDARLIDLPDLEKFFLRFEDTGGKLIHVGPIPGDPFEKIDFVPESAKRLRIQEQFEANSLPWRRAASAVRTLLRKDSIAARRQGFALLKEMPRPRYLGDFDEYLELAEAALEKPADRRDRKAAEKGLLALNAKIAKLDNTRVAADPENYYPPREVEEPHPDSFRWGPEKNGLRLGIAPVFRRTNLRAAEAPDDDSPRPEDPSNWRHGDEFKIDLWIENVSDQPIIFSTTGPRPDEGARLVMTDDRGIETSADRIFSDLLIFFDHICLEPKQKGFLKTLEWRVRPVLDRRNGEYSALDENASWTQAVFSLAPGEYTFQISAPIPGSEHSSGAGKDRKITTPAKGEWTGTLRSAEISVSVISPPEKEEKKTHARSTAPETGSEKVSPGPPNQNPETEESPLEKARAAIERFLKAPTCQERLPHIYAGERLRDKISAYYQSHSDQAIDDYHVKYLLEDQNPVDGDLPLKVFFVKITDREGEFPVAARKTPEGWKVDWEAFVEFHDREFGRFIESGAPGPKQFRVILERHSYRGKDRGKMKGYLSYLVESPDPENSTHAFVNADSTLAARLEKYFSWGAGPIATTIELERKKLPHGENHYFIKRLVADPEATDGWHVKPVGLEDAGENSKRRESDENQPFVYESISVLPPIYRKGDSAANRESTVGEIFDYSGIPGGMELESTLDDLRNRSVNQQFSRTHAWNQANRLWRFGRPWLIAPGIDEGKKAPSPLPLLLSLKKDDEVYLGDKLVPVEDLAKALGRLKAANPGIKLELKADQEADIALLVQVWDALKKAGIEIEKLPLRILLNKDGK